MRQALSYSHAATAARIAVAGLVAAGLAACGSLGFGSSNSSAPPSPTKTFLTNLVMGGPEPPPLKQAPQAQTSLEDNVLADCPSIDILPNAAALRVTTGAPDGGSDTVRHQLSITKVARECGPSAGNTYSMKIGVEGSALLGPQGAPGTFDVPLLFEAKLNDKVVASRRERIAVTVPEGQARAYFTTVIQDFVVPKDEDIEVFVGLEGGTAKVQQVARRTRRR